MAVSDIHVGHQGNKPVVEEIRPDSPEDWLIVAGDVAERSDDIRWALKLLRERFAKVIWVPGNHELWTTAKDPVQMHGAARYDYLVAMCRDLDVLTPEDPFPVWTGAGAEAYGGAVTLAPLFLLYDYSFRPDHVPKDEVVAWAAEERAVCSDEVLLSPDPYPSRQAWCAARISHTRQRLDQEVPEGRPTVLVNHYPLREEFVYLPRIPRFSPWCGTRATENWHQRYRALACVSGHLHIRRTDWRDGTRFEEVSLGYPKQWRQGEGLKPYLREILPGPLPQVEEPGTIFHGYGAKAEAR